MYATQDFQVIPRAFSAISDRYNSLLAGAVEVTNTAISLYREAVPYLAPRLAAGLKIGRVALGYLALAFAGAVYYAVEGAIALVKVVAPFVWETYFPAEASQSDALTPEQIDALADMGAEVAAGQLTQEEAIAVVTSVDNFPLESADQAAPEWVDPEEAPTGILPPAPFAAESINPSDKELVYFARQNPTQFPQAAKKWRTNRKLSKRDRALILAVYCAD